MTIFIPEFWLGVIATVLVEFIGLVLAAMLSGSRKRRP